MEDLPKAEKTTNNNNLNVPAFLKSRKD